MIDQKKISERIWETNPFTDSKLIDGYQTGFKAGVRFAEEELQKLFIDFHVAVIKQGLIEEGEQKWNDAYEPKVRETATNYFAKVMEEISQQPTAP